MRHRFHGKRAKIIRSLSHLPSPSKYTENNRRDVALIGAKVITYIYVYVWNGPYVWLIVPLAAHITSMRPKNNTDRSRTHLNSVRYIYTCRKILLAHPRSVTIFFIIIRFVSTSFSVRWLFVEKVSLKCLKFNLIITTVDVGKIGNKSLTSRWDSDVATVARESCNVYALSVCTGDPLCPEARIAGASSASS